MVDNKGKEEKKEEEIDNKYNNETLLNRVFFSKYKTVQKLGEGSFGQIYKAIYNNEEYALKFEDRKKGQDLLESEAKIMSYLKGPNIPLVKSYGYSGEYNILVMQVLGKSLEDIVMRSKKFSIKTVCLLGYQMVSILEYIHVRHIIHRDIKPDNFVMGINTKNAVLYLLDFGLAKKYRSSTTLEQYPMINKKKLTGTARYASIHALEGLEQSRRDDLEAVGYVLMYLLRGHLPWQGLKVKSKEDRYKKILERKRQTKSEELCKGYPIEFEEFIDYTRRLEYTEEPNYEMLRAKFMRVIVDELRDRFDYIYDWTTKEDLLKRKQDISNQIDKEINFSGVESRNNNNQSGVYTPKHKGRNLTNKSINNTWTIYRTTQSDVSHRTITVSKGVTDKVDSRCCYM